jgi:hypothetical protein
MDHLWGKADLVELKKEAVIAFKSAVAGAFAGALAETVTQVVRHRKDGREYVPAVVAKTAILGAVSAPLQQAVTRGLRHLLGLPVPGKTAA